MTANWVNYLNIYVTESFWLVRSPKAAKCLKMACQISELGKKMYKTQVFYVYSTFGTREILMWCFPLFY